MLPVTNIITKIIGNDIHNNDNIFQSIDYVQWLLHSLGIWTFKSKTLTKTEKYFNIFRRFLCCFLHVWIIFPLVLRMCDQNSDFDLKIFLFAPITFVSSSLLKYFGLLFREKIISECIIFLKVEFIETDYKEFREIIEENMKVIQRIIYNFSCLMITVAVLYNVVMPITTTKLKNRKYNLSDRVEMFPGYDFFDDATITPYYEIMYCLFLLAIYFFFTHLIGTCGLAIILVGFVHSQIQIITQQFNDIVKESQMDPKVLQIKISKIVIRHINIINFSKNMEKIFQQISLVELIAVTLVVCASEHSYLKFWERREMVNLITYLVTIIGLSSNFLIFCWISEILKEQLFRVGLLSYESSWYELPCKTSSTFILIIAMAQRPQVLTAGGLIELSFVTFVNFLKRTFVYLNILQS